LTNLNSLDLRWNSITNYDAVLATSTNLTSLYLGGNSISNVAFLQNLFRLTFLNLENNQISDLSPLATLTNLSYVVLSENPITNYLALSGLTELVNLELRGNSISNLAFLSGLTRLSYLDLAYNSIRDTLPLSSLTNLNALVLAGNPITNFTGLSGLTNLDGLWLYGNSMIDLTWLQSPTRLTHLILDDNHIADLSPLTGLTNLSNLELSSNPVTNYMVLAGLTNLTHLSVAGNCIIDVSFLEPLTLLQFLDLQKNRINDISVLGALTNLNIVELDYNHLSNIATLQNLPNLLGVGLFGNLLDLSTNSPATTVIQSLQGQMVDVAFLQQNQPPILSSSAKWAIATNITSSLSIYVYDDITPDNQCDQLLIEASSTNTDLIPNEGISFTGTNYNYTLAVTPAPGQIGSTEIMLNVTDDAGLNASFTVLVTVMRPEVVVFPDPNLEAAIHQTMGRPGGTLTSLDLQALTYLYAYDTNITNLSGLEWATNLASLFLNGNSISNLSVLPTLPGLTFFGLENHSVADLSLLAGLTNVTGLRLNGDAITNLTFLQNMPQLTSLSLEGNRITDLSPLAGLTNLESLYLRQNLLTNVNVLTNSDSIQGFPHLSSVYLSRNLLDLTSNSQAMTVVNILLGRGVDLEYLPQRRPPIIEASPSWLIAANTTSWLAFNAISDGPLGSQMIITADSSDPGLMPNTNLSAIHNEKTFWLLATTPATNKTGAITVTLTATDDAGLSNSKMILVTVVDPLELDNALFNSTNLTWQTGGNAAWFGQTNISYDGVSAARSGSIGDAQETWLETTVSGPGLLSFWWKISSESGYDDWLNFYIDGVLQTNRISGEVPWQQQMVFIASGSHVVRWRYSKDSAVGSGSDAAWLDQVNFTRLNWLELVAIPTNGQSQLSLHPIPGKLYELQASTNLADWFPLAVMAATNTTMPYLDQTAHSSTRFYRLYELPASSVWFEQPKVVGNEIHLLLLSQPGLRLEMQASTDLVSWSGLAVITNTLGTVEYTNALTTNFPTRYFRAQVLP
jgi:Leucine-rich repeat (LRR) protein